MIRLIYMIQVIMSGDVLFSSKNKKVIGKFKDELGGRSGVNLWD